MKNIPLYVLALGLILAGPASAQTSPWAFQSYQTTLPLAGATITVVTINYLCASGKTVPVTVSFNQPLANYANQSDADVLAAAIPLITREQQTAAQSACSAS